jgi:glycosyltransferase involved in cell wall biosynthesis
VTVDISIIIPCHNRIELLRQTLKSVEAAINHVTAEIILVDDGSTIPVSEQIIEFSHLPLVVIRQKNSGLTTARYVGLLAATGNYIQFLDSDDQVAINKFDIQLKQMQIADADISHTDIIECHYDQSSQKLISEQVRKIPHYDDPADFFIKVQPAPHSPVFKREYLVSHISQAFIPLSRAYDSIGEIWFYYNLSIYPAKIIKIDTPLTIIIHHDDGRLTDNWELMGLCALTLQYQFAAHLPSTPIYNNKARKLVAVAAFETFRRLPYNMDKSFQNAFIDVWKKLGKTTIKELNGGKYFSFAAKIIGPVNAAGIVKRLSDKDYNKMRSVDEDQLKTSLKAILNEFQNKKP